MFEKLRGKDTILDYACDLQNTFPEECSIILLSGCPCLFPGNSSNVVIMVRLLDPLIAVLKLRQFMLFCSVHGTLVHWASFGGIHRYLATDSIWFM